MYNEMNAAIVNGRICLIDGSAFDVAMLLIANAMEVLKNEYGDTELFDAALSVVRKDMEIPGHRIHMLKAGDPYAKAGFIKGAEDIVRSIASIWDLEFRHDSDSDYDIARALCEVVEIISKKRELVDRKLYDGTYIVGEKEDEEDDLCPDE